MPTKLQLNGGPDSSHCVNFFTARIHQFSRMNPTSPTPSAKMKRNQNSQEGGNSSTSPHHSTETLTEESENYLSKHQAVQKELKENVRNLEEWLKETESILKEPLKFNQMWSQEAIDNKMQEIQVAGCLAKFCFTCYILLYSSCEYYEATWTSWASLEMMRVHCQRVKEKRKEKGVLQGTSEKQHVNLTAGG